MLGMGVFMQAAHAALQGRRRGPEATGRAATGTATAPLPSPTRTPAVRAHAALRRLSAHQSSQWYSCKGPCPQELEHVHLGSWAHV